MVFFHGMRTLQLTGAFATVFGGALYAQEYRFLSLDFSAYTEYNMMHTCIAVCTRSRTDGIFNCELCTVVVAGTGNILCSEFRDGQLRGRGIHMFTMSPLGLG